VGSGGPRPPRRPQSVQVAPLPGGWRPAPAVAGIPPLAGFGLVRSPPTLATWTAPKPRDRGPRSRRAGHADKASSSDRRLGSAGLGKLVRVVFDLGGPVDRLFRRRGQVLVVVGALLGALIGTALGLIAEDAQTSTAVVASGPRRGAALAASSPSSHPPPSRAAGSGDGNDSPGNRRAESPGRPDKRDGKAKNDRAGGKDKPGKSKGKGKGK
jgi:hypothetical protein